MTFLTSGPPTLDIAPASGLISLSWTAASTANFVLQSTTNLAGNVWTAVRSTPTVNGNSYTLQLPVGKGTTFFRLAN